jgi:hypothetical protein
MGSSDDKPRLNQSLKPKKIEFNRKILKPKPPDWLADGLIGQRVLARNNNLRFPHD